MGLFKPLKTGLISLLIAGVTYMRPLVETISRVKSTIRDVY